MVDSKKRLNSPRTSLIFFASRCFRPRVSASLYVANLAALPPFQCSLEIADQTVLPEMGHRFQLNLQVTQRTDALEDLLKPALQLHDILTLRQRARQFQIGNQAARINSQIVNRFPGRFRPGLLPSLRKLLPGGVK